MDIVLLLEGMDFVPWIISIVVDIRPWGEMLILRSFLMDRMDSIRLNILL